MACAGNGEYDLHALCDIGLSCQILDLGRPVIVEVQTSHACAALIVSGIDCLVADSIVIQLLAIDPYFVQRYLEILKGIGSEIFTFAVRCDADCQELYGIRTAAGHIPCNAVCAVTGDRCYFCAVILARLPVGICADHTNEVCLTDRIAGRCRRCGGFRGSCGCRSFCRCSCCLGGLSGLIRVAVYIEEAVEDQGNIDIRPFYCAALRIRPVIPVTDLQVVHIHRAFKCVLVLILGRSGLRDVYCHNILPNGECICLICPVGRTVVVVYNIILYCAAGAVSRLIAADGVIDDNRGQIYAVVLIGL